MTDNTTAEKISNEKCDWETLFTSINMTVKNDTFMFKAIDIAKLVNTEANYVRTLRSMGIVSMSQKENKNEPIYLTEYEMYAYLLKLKTEKALNFNRFLVGKLQQIRQQEYSDRKILEQQYKKTKEDFLKYKMASLDHRMTSTDVTLHHRKIIEGLMEGEFNTYQKSAIDLANYCIARYFAQRIHRETLFTINNLPTAKYDKIVKLAYTHFNDTNYEDLYDLVNDVIIDDEPLVNAYDPTINDTSVRYSSQTISDPPKKPIIRNAHGSIFHIPSRDDKK